MSTHLCFWVEIKKIRYWNCCPGPFSRLAPEIKPHPKLLSIPFKKLPCDGVGSWRRQRDHPGWPCAGVPDHFWSLLKLVLPWQPSYQPHFHDPTYEKTKTKKSKFLTIMTFLETAESILTYSWTIWVWKKNLLLKTLLDKFADSLDHLSRFFEKRRIKIFQVKKKLCTLRQLFVK